MYLIEPKLVQKDFGNNCYEDHNKPTTASFTRTPESSKLKKLTDGDLPYKKKRGTNLGS
jgi:hypothetical protein